MVSDKENDLLFPITESDSLYDQDILTERLCPKCGERIVSCPNCSEYCSVCEWENL